MDYFIADSHFGHANIIRLCSRPFSDVDQMDGEMIRLWNARVRTEDTVWILGDLFFRHPDPVAVLNRLEGRKHLILGNHDSSWTGDVPLEEYFDEVTLMREISVGGQELTLCHYPLLTWNQPMRSCMIHGHIHGNTNADYWPLICARSNMLNAGVEINGYQPVTLEELQENNRIWKQAHGGETLTAEDPERRAVPKD